MFEFFNKKKEVEVEIEEQRESIGTILLRKEDNPTVAPIIKEKRKNEQNHIQETKEVNELTTQYIDMGIDMKNEVAKFSKAFFNSKNKLKEESYLRFQSYLTSIPYDKRNEIQNIKYLTFKEKEEQISTTLKNGFAQFLSKGSVINEESKTIIDLVFGDIKKMPSRGHRYWYYKIYIWQKREN